MKLFADYFTILILFVIKIFIIFFQLTLLLKKMFQILKSIFNKIKIKKKSRICIYIYL